MMAMGFGNRVAVIGGGLLDLEAAVGMAAHGVDVTVVHIMGHLMERQLDPAAGYLFKKSLEAKGITVLLNAKSTEIVGENGRARALRLGRSSRLIFWSWRWGFGRF